MPDDNSTVTYSDAMFVASEAVYGRITRGEVTDVDAELWQARYDTSPPDPPQ